MHINFPSLWRSFLQTPFWDRNEFYKKLIFPPYLFSVSNVIRRNISSLKIQIFPGKRTTIYWTWALAVEARTRTVPTSIMLEEGHGNKIRGNIRTWDRTLTMILKTWTASSTAGRPNDPKPPIVGLAMRVRKGQVGTIVQNIEPGLRLLLRRQHRGLRSKWGLDRWEELELWERQA